MNYVILYVYLSLFIIFQICRLYASIAFIIHGKQVKIQFNYSYLHDGAVVKLLCKSLPRNNDMRTKLVPSKKTMEGFLKKKRSRLGVKA